MAPPQAEQQQRINTSITALAAADAAALWPRVDWESPHAAAAIKTVYGGIVTRYGQAAAAVAAQFYDELRADKNLPTHYTAAPADPLPQTVINKVVDSAFLGNPDTSHVHVTEDTTTSDLPPDQRVPARLDDSLQRLVMQPARNTIAENTAHDPAKPVWVRLPQGATTCAFCIMLASREIGYHSEHSALFTANGSKYHKHCDCQAIPVFPGDNAHDISPNMPDYRDMYRKAAADAGTHSDTSKILASMRQLHDLK